MPGLNHIAGNISVCEFNPAPSLYYYRARYFSTVVIQTVLGVEFTTKGSYLKVSKLPVHLLNGIFLEGLKLFSHDRQ